MHDMYKKIKKQNGEAFAQTLRNYHNGLLEIPDIDKIVRHAGAEAAPLLQYLMSLLPVNDDAPAPAPPVPQDPFVLLDQAGYKAFYADTLDAQNSIKKYFQPRELLCTFNDSARYQRYHIVHAVKKDVDNIKREDFKGKEEREDAYGTSVISIQMLKSGGFISIKNRYNHTVNGCDNTFNSNPDNIIEGLSVALKDHFNVEFSASKKPLPEGLVLVNGQIFKYHEEGNNVYYGDQAWVKDGVIHTVDKGAGDALFGEFLFDSKTKTLKKIDPQSEDSFARDFNRDYGGNHGLNVQNGNLVLNGQILIGTEKSRIKTVCLPALTTMSDYCLYNAIALTQFEAPSLVTMGKKCLTYSSALTKFEANALTSMGKECFCNTHALTHFKANALITMGIFCLSNTPSLTHFETNALTDIGAHSLYHASTLTQFIAPSLKKMGSYCLYDANALKKFVAPALTKMGNYCLSNARALTQFEANALTSIGSGCLDKAPIMIRFKANARMLTPSFIKKGFAKLAGDKAPRIRELRL